LFSLRDSQLATTPLAPPAHPVDLDEPAALVVQLATRWHDRVPELGRKVVCVVVRLVKVTWQRAERQLHPTAAAAAAAAASLVTVGIKLHRKAACM
jgi:hypothetical protein